MNMACQCKDENGSPLDKCLGICKYTMQTINLEEQRRANFELTIHQDMIQIGNQIAALAQQIANLPKLLIEANNNGFMEGFKQGYQAGEERC
jgi:hypothetical protein